jgi:hypothetical protein
MREGKLLTLNHNYGSIEFLAEQTRESHVGQIGTVWSSSTFTWREQDNLFEQLASTSSEYMAKLTGEPGPFQYWKLYQYFCLKVPLLGLSWSSS